MAVPRRRQAGTSGEQAALLVKSFAETIDAAGQIATLLSKVSLVPPAGLEPAAKHLEGACAIH
ncbi:hypothetical protein SSP35_22_00770 [Streptomyces sp. NBRC 110611]|nr:hypothetical protein SSP35_22_00770 [Streptomyces sp. NBRC 110611]